MRFVTNEIEIENSIKKLKVKLEKINLGFCISKDIKRKKWYLPIPTKEKPIVQFNIPLVNSAIERRLSAGFAVDGVHNNYLFHTGNITDGKHAFLKWYASHGKCSLKFIDSTEVILIGSIESEDFIEKLKSFVDDVSKFKRL